MRNIHKPIAALLTAFLLLGAATLFAAPPKGKDILKNIQRAYKKLKSFSCDFTMETRLDVIDAVESSTGSMDLKGKKLMRLETRDMIISTDGKSVWRYNRISNTGTIDYLQNEEQVVLPREILLEYPEYFTISGVKEEKLNGKLTYRLTLQPIDQKFMLADLTVWVDSDDYFARRIEWSDEMGNRISYVLTKIQIDPTIADNHFQHVIPDSAKTYDLR